MTPPGSVNAADRLKLSEYLNGGGNLYIEGVNIAKDLASTQFNNYLGLTFEHNGNNYEVEQLFGTSNPLVNQMVFNYFGGEEPHYSVDRMGTTSGQVLFTCESGHGRMVLNEGAQFKAISSSVILGALANGNGLNIKPYLVAEIVNYFLRFEVTPVTPGDANCDEIVNVMDVITIISYLLQLNPDPFCFENADVNADNVINVIDAVATISIIMGNKNENLQGHSSGVAHIFLNDNTIALQSDGTLTGIQFEIDGARSWQMDLTTDGFEFMSNVIDGKLIGIVFSPDNSPLPAGNISLFSITDASDWNWGEVIGANTNAQEVKIVTHKSDGLTIKEPLLVSVFPNPAKDFINISANHQIESLRIFNQLGQIVIDSQVHAIEKSMNIMNLRRGVYVLEVKTNGDLIYQKVLIE